MELSIATALKRHPWSLANTTRFVALSCLAWLAVTTIVWLAWDDVPPFASAPWLSNAMQYAGTVTVFAGVQRWLLRRWLRVELRSWLRYSIVGALAGAACYLAFRNGVPAPYEFWQYQRYSPPPEPVYLFAKDVYFGLSDFFKYGVVAFCQFLAFPRQWQGRRLWLVAAFAAAPLWNVSQSLVAVMILSLALAHITTNIQSKPAGKAK
ncbi:MAG: hypothetical protein F4X46_04435 [Chloroflexi bacterium]|nr:hypothetical protein [Chloroflexota bacterium]